VVNKINGFWIPACAGMTDFLRFFTFFNTLLAQPVQVLFPPADVFNNRLRAEVHAHDGEL
jgi:hypothetical protein